MRSLNVATSRHNRPPVRALLAAHQRVAVAPVFFDQGEAAIYRALGAIGLVGHLFGMHQQIQIAA